MDLTISNQESIRTLSKILTFSAKISDSMQITPQPPFITLRILNTTQSAFTSFQLHPSFFTTRAITSRSPVKLPTRALLPIFRAPGTINTIHITSPPLTVTVNTKTVTKTFTPPLLEGRVPSICSSQTSCSFVTTPSFLASLLQNFHSKLDEITLVPATESLRLLSFVDDAGPASVMLRTEITVSSSELESLNVQDQPTELTLFCRPFRAAIDFCDAYDEVLTVSYEDPGSPVVLEMSIPTGVDVLVEAKFVFASRLAEEGVVKRRNRLGTQAEKGASQRGSQARSARERREVSQVQPTPVESSGGAVEATPEVSVERPRSVFDIPLRHGYDEDAERRDEDKYVGEEEVQQDDGHRYGRDDGYDDDDDFVEGTPPPEE